jgi:hypothetical protein
VFGSLVGLGVAFASFFSARAWVVLLEGCFAVFALVALWPTLGGRWGRGAWVAPQSIAVGIVLLGYGALALYAGEQARDGLLGRSTHAMPSNELAGWTGAAVASVLAVVLVVWVLPIELGRRGRAALVAALALTGVAAAGTAVAIAAGGDPCDDLRLDSRAFAQSDDRQRIGEALVRCDALVGLHEDELEPLLGRPSTAFGQHSWTLGRRPGMIWGETVTLSVTLDGERVIDAEISSWRD